MAENIEHGGQVEAHGHGGHEHAGDHGHEHDHGHHIDYKKIYITLLILLVISVAGPFLGIFWVTILTAFGIAIVKAALVVQNFMHLKIERQIAKWVLAVSLLLLFLFFAGVAPDVMKHDGAGWENLAAKAVVEAGIDSGEHEEGEEEHAEEGEGEGEAEVVVAAFAPDQAYQQICSTCHGATGQGDGAGAAALDPKPATFTDPEFWETRNDADLVTVIREGGAAIGKSAQMAPWGALYDEEQAQQIVDYIRNTFGPGA